MWWETGGCGTRGDRVCRGFGKVAVAADVGASYGVCGKASGVRGEGGGEGKRVQVQVGGEPGR